MENTKVEETTTVTTKTVPSPATGRRDFVEDSRTVAREGAKALTDASTTVVEASKQAIRDAADASERLARNVKESVPRTTGSVTTPATVEVTA
jgi:hypothetical protein